MFLFAACFYLSNHIKPGWVRTTQYCTLSGSKTFAPISYGELYLIKKLIIIFSDETLKEIIIPTTVKFYTF